MRSPVGIPALRTTTVLRPSRALSVPTTSRSPLMLRDACSSSSDTSSCISFSTDRPHIRSFAGQLRWMFRASASGSREATSIASARLNWNRRLGFSCDNPVSFGTASSRTFRSRVGSSRTPGDGKLIIPTWSAGVIALQELADGVGDRRRVDGAEAALVDRQDVEVARHGLGSCCGLAQRPALTRRREARWPRR